MLFLKQGTKKFFIKKSLLLKKVRVKMTLNLTRNILFVIMLFSPIISLPVLTDVAEPWQLGFQDPATPTMEGIIEFHNNLMFFITLIAIFTTWVIVRCISFFLGIHLNLMMNYKKMMVQVSLLIEKLLCLPIQLL